MRMICEGNANAAEMKDIEQCWNVEKRYVAESSRKSPALPTSKSSRQNRTKVMRTDHLFALPR